MQDGQDDTEKNGLDEEERWQVLTQLEEWLDGPMVFLSFLWLVLVELIWTTLGVFDCLER